MFYNWPLRGTSNVCVWHTAGSLLVLALNFTCKQTKRDCRLYKQTGVGIKKMVMGQYKKNVMRGKAGLKVINVLDSQWNCSCLFVLSP